MPLRASYPPDPHDRTKSTLLSMSYLDQIAAVCLAAGVRACEAPKCLLYRSELKEVVPKCPSWEGLWDWVLCITSCSLRAIGETNSEPSKITEEPTLTPQEKSKSKRGLLACRKSGRSGLPYRLWTHLTVCILLTSPPGDDSELDWSIAIREYEYFLEGTTNENGSIGGPRPDQKIYALENIFVSSRRCSHFTPGFLIAIERQIYNICPSPSLSNST